MRGRSDSQSGPRTSPQAGRERSQSCGAVGQCRDGLSATRKSVTLVPVPLTLITGGSRSGKSTHAITLATAGASSLRRYFIATAEALDDEMRARIAHHQASRPPEFVTIEAPLELEAAIAALTSRADVAVLDCLTLWVSNLMGQDLDDSAIIALSSRSCPIRLDTHSVRQSSTATSAREVSAAIAASSSSGASIVTNSGGRLA